MLIHKIHQSENLLQRISFYPGNALLFYGYYAWLFQFCYEFVSLFDVHGVVPSLLQSYDCENLAYDACYVTCSNLLVTILDIGAGIENYLCNLNKSVKKAS